MITFKGYLKMKCVHRGKESFKEQYFANIDVWIRD